MKKNNDFYFLLILVIIVSNMFWVMKYNLADPSDRLLDGYYGYTITSVDTYTDDGLLYKYNVNEKGEHINPRNFTFISSSKYTMGDTIVITNIKNLKK